MSILFDAAFLLYGLAYVPYLILTGRWHRGYKERFGFLSAETRSRLKPGGIWVHAVSVGEVQAIHGIIRSLHAQGASIVCTVTTKTGYDLAQERLGSMAVVLPSPVDFSVTVKTFIKAIQPKLYIAAETELWPNLFHGLHQHGVPIAIVNGRISDRSFGRYKLITPVLKQILSMVNIFAMQSEEDARRIITLGAPPERVMNVGNIKFDDSVEGVDLISLADPAYPMLVAGSTHPGEEDIILDIFKRVQERFPEWRLVLAPRHVERAKAVAQSVEAKGLRPLFLSQVSAPVGAGTVVVVDVIGRLRQLYASASLVFVGKSICVGGGHNIIEPAMLGKAVVIGPHMDNFRDVTRCFAEENGVKQVEDKAGLDQALEHLMANARERQEMGKRALAVVEKNRGARQRTMGLIKQWL